MRARRTAAVLSLCLGLAVAGCGSDEPLDAPVAASLAPAPSTAPSPSPSPSPSPVPSPSPLSAFEDDPAVKGLRAYFAAAAEAVNARDLQLPALLATSTAERAGRHPKIYGDDLGSYYPGPRPVAVLGVRSVNGTKKLVLGCSLQNYALDKPGGTLLVASEVVGGTYEMVLEGGAWKLNAALKADDVTCNGITPPVVGG